MFMYFYVGLYHGADAPDNNTIGSDVPGNIPTYLNV